MLLVILIAVVDVVAVAIVAADVAGVIVDAADVVALIAVVVVVALTAVVGAVALTAVAGVAALIVAADVGDLVVLPAVALAAPFVAGERLLSLVPSLLLRMSEPSVSNVQDMGPLEGWSRSLPIISRPN